MNLIVFTALLALNSTNTESACPYPADPINWISRYCALVVGTDDEIAIQASECFKKYEPDLKSKNKCAINKKYKSKACEEILKHSKKYKSVQECLKDKAVTPFFAGGN